jgi:hypothetical protein
MNSLPTVKEKSVPTMNSLPTVKEKSVPTNISLVIFARQCVTAVSQWTLTGHRRVNQDEVP